MTVKHWVNEMYSELQRSSGMPTKDETREERRHRALYDADLRADIAKSAHDTQEETSLDGLSKHVTYVDKDGVGLADETVSTNLGEAVEAFKRELLLAAIGTVPAVQSGEIEVGKSAKDDQEVTVTLRLSRTPQTYRLPQAKQGTTAK